MNVFIDPRSTINYSSFYVQGLYDYFGKSKVHFSSRYFRELEEIDILLAFVLVKDGEIKKIIVDYRDQTDIINAAFLWADTYAKININDSTLSEKSKKLIKHCTVLCHKNMESRGIIVSCMRQLLQSRNSQVQKE